MATLYLFGLVASDVATNQLGWLQSTDSTKLSDALNKGAATVGLVLWQSGITASDVTLVDYPEDYHYCRDLVEQVAAVKYLGNAAGAEAEELKETVRLKLRALQNNPSFLKVYTTVSEQGVAVTHTTELSDDDVTAYRKRMEDPTDQGQWESM